MTVLGKILVFVNLVFSLVTAGLIVMVFTTRTNWNDAFKKLTATNTVVLSGETPSGPVARVTRGRRRAPVVVPRTRPRRPSRCQATERVTKAP